MAQTRRQFLATSAAAAAASAAETTAAGKDDISLASWSLVRSFRAGKWTNLDLPRILREDFQINGLEYVNTFFENPTMGYLKKLKANCEQHGIRSVLIMVDNEGDTAAIDKAERIQAAIAHRKWVDTAHYLGCHAIRCNMRGGLEDFKQDKDIVKRAAESFRNLLDYAKDSGLSIVIENHGGPSSNADILVALMKEVNDSRFGILPDFGNFEDDGLDHYDAIRRFMPYAKGVSVKASWTIEEKNSRFDLERMIQIARDGAYHGFWGIESSYGNPPRVRGQRPPEVKLSPEQAWERDKKGVMLTKAVLQRTVVKQT